MSNIHLRVICPGRKLGNLGYVGNLGHFFLVFPLATFRFWSNTQNGKLRRKKLGKKFRRFRRFRVFDLPLFHLTFSSDRLSFFRLYGFFVFFSYFVWICYYRQLDCNYPTCQSMFKVERIQRNVYYICLKLKKLTKLILVTARSCLI